jgi:hypothetical protein
MPKRATSFRRVADTPKTYIRPEFLNVGDRPMKTGFRYWTEHVIHWHALLFAISFGLWIGMSSLGAFAHR